MKSRTRPAAATRGALLIEVLIALLLCAFGLLGFAALQARASSAQFEALQRSQALILLQDMASRVNANRANAGDYVTAGLLGEAGLEDCTALASAALDRCEWGNLLRGNSETRATASVGAMLSARGCIVRAAGTTDRYVLSVAWVGVTGTGAPTSTCGQGDAVFPDEAVRRVVSLSLCVGQLRDPAVAPAVPRC